VATRLLLPLDITRTEAQSEVEGMDTPLYWDADEPFRTGSPTSPRQQKKWVCQCLVERSAVASLRFRRGFLLTLASGFRGGMRFPELRIRLHPLVTRITHGRAELEQVGLRELDGR